MENNHSDAPAVNLQNDAALQFYRQINLGGRRMLTWYEDITEDLTEKIRLAWASCHICFAFLQLRGPFFTETNAETLHKLFKLYEDGVMDLIDEEFILFLYSYLVSQYGHLDPDPLDTFTSTVEGAILHIEETGGEDEYYFQFQARSDMVLFPNPPGILELHPVPNGTAGI